MKNLIILTAAAMAASTMSAVALEADDVRSAYSADAFDGADADWRRITANRVDGCGRYGEKRTARVDVLIDRYLAIGEALDANDNAAAVTATERLSRAINLNGRFEMCWDKISRRNGVSRDFRDMIKDL